MDYSYSEEVDPSLYETHGLTNQIKLRMHKDPVKEIRGTLRAQEDWSKHVRPIKNYQGGLSDRYSFMSVTVPECLPDRLEIISYLSEYAFLYDDELENVDLRNSTSNTGGMLDTFTHDALNTETTRPEKRILAQILSEMMAIDSERAITSIKAWEKFVQMATETRKSQFKTLETYIPARVIDAGALILYGVLTFGMAITIPADERDLCTELAKPGYIALALTNDLYSWEKECIAAEKLGQNYVFNAIWVIMEERAVDEHEAKRICSDEIRRHMADYERVVEIAKNDQNLSKDLRKYLDAVLLSCVGNVVWSIYCPRYRV
ncbi:isoprenoid synthase domain-containing protein [Xylaria cf. heliscus]|nr:isoprenoid synthase domain-containing protein [Xylaria cf. heliscus]